jgi:hypothetical protein
VGCPVHAFDPIKKSKFSNIGRGMVSDTILNGLGPGVHALIKRKKMISLTYWTEFNPSRSFASYFLVLFYIRTSDVVLVPRSVA